MQKVLKQNQELYENEGTGVRVINQVDSIF